MGSLRDRTLRQLLDDVAARTPAPGGGTAAAWTCAVAAGLVEMTAAFTRARPEHAARHARMERLAARAAELRAEAQRLAETELTAFEPVLVALRLPAAEPGRSERLAAALSTAADSPLAIARVAAEVAELALEATRTGTAHLTGDARTGVLLADGACQAAAGLASTNLEDRPDDPRHAELAELTGRAARARAAVV